jgi:magnesium-transporting ATPase (P-type)
MKDSFNASFANVGIVSSLIGMTTYSAITNPLTAAEIDGSGASNNLMLFRAYTIVNVISTMLSLLSIFLCCWYGLVIAVLLPSNEEFVYFAINTPAAFICFVFCSLGVLFAVMSLFISFFIIYSRTTAYISLSIGLTFLMLFFKIASHTGGPLFSSIGKRMAAIQRHSLGRNEEVEP